MAASPTGDVLGLAPQAPIPTASAAVSPSSRIDALRERLPLRAAALPVGALLFILLGALLTLSPFTEAQRKGVWLVGLVLTGTPVVWRTLRGLAAGRFAADLVAAMAIVGAAVLAQPLAGLVVVLMQTGGEALERFAVGRASQALHALQEAAPRTAHLVLGAEVVDVAVEEIRVGELVLIRPGELVPCDAVVVGGRSHVDASRLTGEPVPFVAEVGAPLMSGSVNLEGSLTARATALATESQYARIVELVRSAQASKAPLQRLADRYAVWFTPATLIVCVAAYLATGDMLRVLAVLVVATPCPLILATPVAIVGGINQAARRQIIVRHGGALEQLAGVRVAVFDKTGTVTVGIPAVSRVVPAAAFSERELLRLAGAVEQGSSHLLARSVVNAAQAAHERLPQAYHVTEAPGQGVDGEVEGRAVTVGSRSFVVTRNPDAAQAIDALDRGHLGLRAHVAINGVAAGIIEFADRVRPEIVPLLRELTRLGVRRTLLLSGDHQVHTRAVADEVGIQEAVGDLLPEDKVRVIRALAAGGDGVLMVGDGTNDAPALTSAAVGIALAAHGGGITAEAADAVILADDVMRVADAIRISRRTLRIAKQSIWVGLGLSAVAMAFASVGMIHPTIGALLQEGIDVAVIVNALRASRA